MNEEQTAQATALQPGDVVRLKSGGPEVTVMNHWGNNPEIVNLVYMTDEGIVQEYAFPEACLEKLPDYGGDHDSSEDDLSAFNSACEPLIKYLAQNHHPHTQVIVTGNSAEMVEGVMSYLNAEYVPD